MPEKFVHFSGVDKVAEIPRKSNKPIEKIKIPETNFFEREGRTWRIFKLILKTVALLTCLYFFVCSLDLMSSAFRLLGGRYAKTIFTNSAILGNPIAGLMIGVLVTVLVQSSSTSTSIVVSMVASEILQVKYAIPIIMGANIGTSITSTLVSFSQVANRDNFRRAYAGATVHDIFNFLSVMILLPLEAASGFLETITSLLVKPLAKYTHNNEIQLLDAVTKPFTKLIIQLDSQAIENIGSNQTIENQPLIKHLCKTAYFGRFNDTHVLPKNLKTVRCQFLFESVKWPEWLVGLVLLIVSLASLCVCLVLLVKILSSIFQGPIAKIISKVINAEFPGCFNYFTGYLAILIGASLTIIVQSSSVFTSTLTPLVGLGLVTIERVFPLILGSNLGTTITGILAALSGPSRTLQFSLQIALCHTFFNLTGILIWYPIPYLRKIPIRTAQYLGKRASEYRWFAVFYIVLVFLLIPGIVFGLSMLGLWVLLTAISIAFVISLSILVLNLLQKKRPSILPVKLRSWHFMPSYLRSLEPYDKFMAEYFMCGRCRRGGKLEEITKEVENTIKAADEKSPGERVKILGEAEIFKVSKLYSLQLIKDSFDKNIP